MGNALNTLVFQPPRATYTHNDPHLHMVPTKNGHTIAAYFIRNRKAKLTILFSHGNAEDIGTVVHALMTRIGKWEANIFIYDYSGYGLSGGRPSEHNVYMDVEAAYDYLTDVIGVDERTIVPFGRSIGSGPAIHIALHRKVVGLILQCPVASIYRVKLKRVAFTLPGDIFCNIDKVTKLRVPTLIIHGTNDEVVPIKCSKQMALKIPEVYCRWIKGASHNDMDAKYAVYVERALQEFFYKVIPTYT